MKKSAALFLGLLAILSAAAQGTAEKKIIEISLRDNRTMQHLDILTNRIGGRPIGSDAYNNAAQWAAQKFREWGLDVTFEEAGELPVGFNRGPWFGYLSAEKSMQLHFATPSYSSGTRGVQRGHVLIEPHNEAEFERMKGKLKGAWILVEGKSSGRALDWSDKAQHRRDSIKVLNAQIEKDNQEINRRIWQTRKEEPFKEPVREPALFMREMIEAGVLGFIQSAPVPITSLYDANVAKGKDITLETLPTTPDIKLDEDQYAQIRKMVEQRREIYLTFDIRNHFKPGPVKYHNVVACIKGSKYPEQSVIVSGHLDSYDTATGGVDCGSGVSVVMEAARMIALSGAKPKRTIYFILFAGEEFGLLGAKAWVKSHPERLEGISNVFNRDGGPLAYTEFQAPESLVKQYEKIAKPLQEAYPEYGFKISTLQPRKTPKRPGGTDATVFATHGVPIISPRESDCFGHNFAYREIWHTERDTYSKSIPEYQNQAAAVMAILALGTANLDTILPREEVYKE